VVEIVNHLIFSLSFLFGIEAPLVSEHSLVTIDDEKKMAIIEYQNVQVPFEHLNKIAPYVLSLDSAQEFDEQYPGIELLKKEKLKVDGKTNYIITFKFSDTDVFKKYFKIDIENDQIILHDGETISVNGKKNLETKADRPGKVNYDPGVGPVKFYYSRKEHEIFDNMKGI